VLVMAVELSALLGGDAATIALEENLELLGSGAIFIAVASELVTRFGVVFVRVELQEVPAADVAGVFSELPAERVVVPPVPVR
jgi:hypothetical protein